MLDQDSYCHHHCGNVQTYKGLLRVDGRKPFPSESGQAPCSGVAEANHYAVPNSIRRW